MVWVDVYLFSVFRGHFHLQPGVRLQEWPFKGVTRVIYYLCKWSDSNPTSSWWLVPQPIWKNMLVKFGPLFPGFGANIRKIFELPPPKTNLNWHFQAPLSGTSKGSFGPTDLSIPPTKTCNPSPKFSVQPSYKAAGRASGLSWSSSGLRPPNQPTASHHLTQMAGWMRGDPGWLVVSTHLKKFSQVGNLPQIVVNINNFLKPPPR